MHTSPLAQNITNCTHTRAASSSPANFRHPFNFRASSFSCSHTLLHEAAFLCRPLHSSSRSLSHFASHFSAIPFLLNHLFLNLFKIAFFCHSFKLGFLCHNFPNKPFSPISCPLFFLYHPFLVSLPTLTPSSTIPSLYINSLYAYGMVSKRHFFKRVFFFTSPEHRTV